MQKSNIKIDLFWGLKIKYVLILMWTCLIFVPSSVFASLVFTASTTPTLDTWNNGFNYCENLKYSTGYSWRLPTLVEYYSYISGQGGVKDPYTRLYYYNLADVNVSDEGLRIQVIDSDPYSTSVYFEKNTQNFSRPNCVYDTSDPLIDLSPTSTRFISILPLNQVTVSTSTSIGAEIFIPDDVYVNNMQLRVTYGLQNPNYQLTALDAWESSVSDTTFYLDISTSTYFSTSSSVVLDVGYYHMQMEIIKVNSYLWGFFNFYDTLISTSSSFLVSTSSTYDIVKKGEIDSLNAFLASTTGALDSNCSITNFHLGKCFISLFIPTSMVGITPIFNDFKDKVLTKFPFGYITNFVSILSSTATTSLPVLSATLPVGVMGAGSSITLDLAEMSWIFNATSTFTTGESAGKTLYQLVEPYWNIIVYLGLGLYILNRLLGAYVIEQNVLERRDLIKIRNNQIDKYNKFGK